MHTEHDHEREQRDADDSDEAGSGRSHEVNSPFSPHEDDDSALGDTDQHSDA